MQLFAACRFSWAVCFCFSSLLSGELWAQEKSSKARKSTHTQQAHQNSRCLRLLRFSIEDNKSFSSYAVVAVVSPAAYKITFARVAVCLFAFRCVHNIKWPACQLSASQNLFRTFLFGPVKLSKLVACKVAWQRTPSNGRTWERETEFILLKKSLAKKKKKKQPASDLLIAKIHFHSDAESASREKEEWKRERRPSSSNSSKWTKAGKEKKREKKNKLNLTHTHKQVAQTRLMSATTRQTDGQH